MPTPIILFVYTRMDQTRKTIDALKSNLLSKESDLYIYSDGAKTKGLESNVIEMRNYLKTISGFKSVNIIESKVNKGLATSIIHGVTEIVNKFGKVIVLEDDIVTSPYFLQFMNSALDTYEDENRVMSISGYMYPHKNKLPETFFFNVPLCWGWATWKRAWEKFNNDSKYHINIITEKKAWKSFNKFGGKYLERQLRKNSTGSMNTWFINWHASVFENKAYCLYPNQTLVNNIGFDSSGEHKANTKVYCSSFPQNNINVQKLPLIESQKAKKIIKNFYRFKANSYIRLINKIIFKLFNK